MDVGCPRLSGGPLQLPKDPMSSNEKPVAIVTGASSGIGLGIAQALLDRGYRVVGTSTFVTGENIRVDGGVHAGRP